MIATANRLPNVTVEVNGLYVRRTRIGGTEIYAYDVYSPNYKNYSTVSYCSVIEGISVGKVGTSNTIPAEIDALPARSEARLIAYRAWRDAEYQVAYNAILAAFPELATNPNARRDMGSIEVS